METTLTSTIKNISPILYDLTVTPLPEDPIEPLKESDLITSISTDNYTPQINDTVKIILNVGNNGPNNASNVKVTYKLPFGMEYLTTNGNYDPITGLWTIDNLDSGSSASLEILAKILNNGNLVNIETVTGLEYDPISANNRAELTLNIPYLDPDNQIPEVPSNLPDNGMATLPPIPNIENLMDLDIYQPGTNPIPPNNPPNPPKPDTPDPNPPGPNPPGPNPPTPPDEPGPNPPGPNTPDPNPPGPDTPGPNPSGPNPPNPTDPNLGPLNTPNTQLARDIRGVRAAVSTGNIEENIPEWNLSLNTDPEKKDEGIPIWVYVMIVFGLIAAVLAYKFRSTLSEYLMAVWNGILNALNTLWVYLSYLGANLEELLANMGYNLVIKYGSYITAALQELWSIPFIGVGPTTIIGLGLRFLTVRFPFLEPYIERVIYILDQLTYYELSEKLKELFNKKIN